MKEAIIERILNKIKIPNLIDLLVNNLSFSELQSLLLKTFEQKIKRKKITDLFSEFQNNRFVKPSDIHPVHHRKLEMTIFNRLPKLFNIIDLAPLTPLGTSSVLAQVHQNNVVSTIRNTEVAADTTNILALECAKRRREQFRINAKSFDLVKLCASQRVTRGQAFENNKFSAYFNVVALCTAGRDEGHDSFEINNLQEHLQFYINLLFNIVDMKEIKAINIKIYKYGEEENTPLNNYLNTMLYNQENINIIIENNSEFGKYYYSRLRFMICIVNQKNEKYNYIDGGFTDWTSKLLNNKKEKLLTSGIGTDLLLRTIKLKSI